MGAISKCAPSILVLSVVTPMLFKVQQHKLKRLFYIQSHLGLYSKRTQIVPEVTSQAMQRRV